MDDLRDVEATGREDRALVESVAADEWDCRHLASQNQVLWRSSQKYAVCARSPRSSETLTSVCLSRLFRSRCKSTHGVVEQVRHRCSRSSKIRGRDLAETVQSVGSVGAPSMLDNLVVELLQLSDVASRDWRPGIHDGSPEEAFVITAIGDHL